MPLDDWIQKSSRDNLNTFHRLMGYIMLSLVLVIVYHYTELLIRIIKSMFQYFYLFLVLLIIPKLYRMACCTVIIQDIKRSLSIPY